MKVTAIAIISCILVICSIIAYSQDLPIKPTRTIPVTTDEGTDMSVDISPDGKTLVFDLLGELFTLPITGGEATQITRGLAINQRPCWSPDGKELAYISDYSGAMHLNVRDISGKFHVVLDSSGEQINYYQSISPTWTSDGHYICFGDMLYAVSGGKVPDNNDLGYLIASSSVSTYSYFMNGGELYRYDRSTGEKKFIPTHFKGYESGLLSPDGRWWAYVADSLSRKCLFIQDIGGTDQRMLVRSLFVKYPYYRTVFFHFHYCFSPDSKDIYIGYGGKIHRINIGTGEDRIIPFLAHVRSEAGAFDYNTYRVRQDSIKVVYTRSANASPDGKHLVFSALDKIYVMDLPAGKPHVLADQDAGQFQPIYSPDGRWIAYVTWRDPVGGCLWRVPASGGRPEPLTNEAGQYERPAWSPDGKSIAVIKGRPLLGDRDDPGIGRLEIVPVNGGPVRLIDDSIALWNQLTFSPDGRTIQYAPKWQHDSQQKFNPALIARSIDGDSVQTIAELPANTGFANMNPAYILERTLSPDNRYIVYSMAEDLYLVPNALPAGRVCLYDRDQSLPVIRFAAGIDPHWEKEGKVLSWAYGNHFYRIDPDKIMMAAEERKARGCPDSSFMTVQVQPDQVLAMDIRAPVFHAQGLLALKHVRIITMEGSRVIEDGAIVIKDGRFLQVGPGSTVVIPRTARILDLTGATVIPGFVDLHLHMRVPPDIFPQQSWMYLVNLAYGVTTARDPSASIDSYGYAELLQTGKMIGPRLYSVGRPVRLYLEDINRVDNLSNAQDIVGKRALYGSTYMKQYTLPLRRQRQWLLMASRSAGLDMTNEGDFMPLIDLGMIKDGTTGIEHNPDWGDVYKDITMFFARSGIYFTPTLQVRYGEDLMREYSNFTYWHDTNQKLARFTPADQLSFIQHPNLAKDTTHSGSIYPAMIDAEIRHLGGKVTLGSHGNNEGIGVHNELWALQMGGLTNMEALQAATIMGAEAMGLQQDIGSIKAGKIADLIVLNKDPLDDIHNSREIRYVMKDGALYDGNTLDEIWPIAKKCPEWKLK